MGKGSRRELGALLLGVHVIGELMEIRFVPDDAVDFLYFVHGEAVPEVVRRVGAGARVGRRPESTSGSAEFRARAVDSCEFVTLS